jgi:hypothetical protein
MTPVQELTDALSKISLLGFSVEKPLVVAYKSNYKKYLEDLLVWANLCLARKQEKKNVKARLRMKPELGVRQTSEGRASFSTYYASTKGRDGQEKIVKVQAFDTDSGVATGSQMQGKTPQSQTLFLTKMGGDDFSGLSASVGEEDDVMAFALAESAKMATISAKKDRRRAKRRRYRARKALKQANYAAKLAKATVSVVKANEQIAKSAAQVCALKVSRDASPRVAQVVGEVASSVLHSGWTVVSRHRNRKPKGVR